MRDDHDLRELMYAPPEIVVDPPGKPNPNDLRVHLPGSDRVRIPKPTRNLRLWLSGKSKDYSDTIVARMVKLEASRVTSFRFGVYPYSWELGRLAAFFTYPEDKLLLLLFVYARKHVQEQTRALMIGDAVLAIVRPAFARKHKLTTFTLGNIGGLEFASNKVPNALKLDRSGD